MANFVESGHSQGYLPPPDMREWVPEDDLSHFVLEAVNRVAMEKFRVNERGTHRDLGVRYVSGNRQPDHDTICKFRRENFAAVEEAFLEVLLLARELKLLRVGTVSVDGTKVDANANPRNSIRYDRAEALREVLREEIGELLGRAESADAEGAEDPQRLPGELSRREKPKSKLDRACAELRRRAEARAESERAEHERKVEARKGREVFGDNQGENPATIRMRMVVKLIHGYGIGLVGMSWTGRPPGAGQSGDRAGWLTIAGSPTKEDHPCRDHTSRNAR